MIAITAKVGPCSFIIALTGWLSPLLSAQAQSGSVREILQDLDSALKNETNEAVIGRSENELHYNLTIKGMTPVFADAERAAAFIKSCGGLPRLPMWLQELVARQETPKECLCDTFIKSADGRWVAFRMVVGDWRDNQGARVVCVADTQGGTIWPVLPSSVHDEHALMPDCLPISISSDQVVISSGGRRVSVPIDSVNGMSDRSELNAAGLHSLPTETDFTGSPVVITNEPLFYESSIKYGAWVAAETTPIYDTIDGRPMQRKIKNGETVTALAGAVSAVPLKAVVMRADPYDNGQGVRVGSSVYYLYDMGDGAMRILHNGRVRESSTDLVLKFEGPEPGANTSQWWVKVRMSDGTTGWIANPKNFDGMSGE